MRQAHVEIERREIERKSNSGVIWSALIRYAAYLIMLFGILYFLVQYVIPMIR